MLKIEEGREHYIGSAGTLEAARDQIFALFEFWPAEYAILDLETGQWTSFPGHELKDRADSGKGSLPVGPELLLKQHVAA